jgi:hypothetical protein
LQDPPQFTQIQIFGLKHLATLVTPEKSLQKMAEQSGRTFLTQAGKLIER